MLYRLEGVSYSYPSGGFALKEVSLDIKKGQKIAVIGPSGSGKTTFLQILTGLLMPTSGRIFFNSQLGVKISRPGEVVMAFQFPENSFITNTVEEEVFLAFKEAGLDLEQGKKNLERITKAIPFNFEEVYNRPPFSLSKGEKRKLALISLLVLKPEVIILDEPESGLDGKSIASLYSFLRSLNEETLIIATHQIDEVFSLADIFVYIFEGEVIFWGTREELAHCSPRIRERIPIEFLPFDIVLKWKKRLIC